MEAGETLIFIDVDGTLIDANDKPIPWTVAAAWVIIAKGLHPVVVWSGGGEDYAARQARRLFPEMDVIPLAKDPGCVRAGDVVVDDGLEFKVSPGAFLKTPQQFAEWVLE